LANVVVADTGPLIAFAYLDLFSLFPVVLDTVLVPEAVMNELHVEPVRPDVRCIQEAIEKQWLRVELTAFPAEDDFPPSLGPGEQAAIHLAREKKCPVLMDDKLARQFAVTQGLTVVGTAGVLIKAKQVGEIAEVTPLLHALGQKGYYFSTALIESIKVIVGEE
jgi:predicted nucleic acid-binding protein